MRSYRFLVTALIASIAFPVGADEQSYSGLHADDKLPAEGSSPLFWQGDEQIAGFRNIHRLLPTRVINAGDRVLELPRAEVDLDDVEIVAGDQRMTVERYMAHQRVGGLLVIKNGKIVYERYGLGNNEDTRWVSFSVSKSIVAMLYGAAIRDGYIKSLDAKVTDYLPLLKNSSYDQTTIKNLLQMASAGSKV